MRTVIQPTSVFTPNMIKRHFELRPKTIVDTEIDQQKFLTSPKLITSDNTEDFYRSPIHQKSKANNLLRPITLNKAQPQNPPSPNQNSKLYSQTYDYNTQSASQKPNRTIPPTHHPPMPKQDLLNQHDYTYNQSSRDKNNSLDIQLPNMERYHRINEEIERFPIYEIGNLTKMYREEDRYSGTSDSFDLCLGIFYDVCLKTGVNHQFFKDAFSIMLKGSAREYYHLHLMNNGLSFQDMTQKLRAHFETDERQLKMISKWKSITLLKTIEENPNKTVSECFELLVTEFRRTQLLLPQRFQGDLSLRDAIIDAVRDIRECSLACYKPAPTFEALCADIRASIATEERLKNVTSTSATFKTFPSTPIEPHDYQLYTDRRYKGSKLRHKLDKSSKLSSSGFTKRCFICKKEGCWSTRHTKMERDKAHNEFRERLVANGKPSGFQRIQQYITECEGIDAATEDPDIWDTLIMNLDFDEDENEIEIYPLDEQFFTSYGNISGYKSLGILNDQSVRHALAQIDSSFDSPTINNHIKFNDFFTKSSPSNTPPISPIDIPTSFIFTHSTRYSDAIFQGVMIDTGAARVSTAGESQFRALCKIQKLQMDRSQAGQANICFGIGTAKSIGSTIIQTPLGKVIFHIMPSNTPFLLCLRDMDILQVKFDNLKNVLIQGKTIVPVIRKWGHPWMLLHGQEASMIYSYMGYIAECHLTEVELRQLHRRFGHPSARRLSRLLQRSGHEFDTKILKRLTKFCHFCQKHGKSPGRFKFTLHDDYEFNHCIYVDIMYIENQPILHVVDSTTRFGAARWLKSMSAQDTWDALRCCWIDVYIGPPDVIAHDAGKNFASKEFRQHASSMSITTKEVPVESHNSIGIVERYHAPLRRAYEIIRQELNDVPKDVVLQMAIKAVNDTAGPDGIVPTLLVFGAYPRLTITDPPHPTIIQRAKAIRAAMKEVRRFYEKRQVTDALRMRNGPDVTSIHNLAVGSKVMVWREKEKWTGPYKYLGIDGESCNIEMPYGPTIFRSTVVKPYYSENLENCEQEPT